MQADNILDQLHLAVLNLLVPLDQESAYKVIVDEAVKLIDCQDGLIVREVDDKLQTVYGSSPQAAAFTVRRHGNTFKALKENKIIVLHDSDLKRTTSPKTHPRNIHSIILVPLSYQETSEGVLIIRRARDKKFSKDEINTLKLFGSIAGLSIKKNESYEATKQALEARDMFISIASHELRTPLTSLNGYIQLLYSKLSKTDSVEAKWTKSLLEESTRLTNLIKELLEINRIKQGTLQFVLREGHFAEVIKRAIERVAFTHRKRKVVFSNKVTKDQDIVIADFDKMLQVVSALLANALKFSPSNTPVSVTLESAPAFLTMRITDKGKGMGREDVRRVFQGFYKNTENLQEGMGVGLMLAKHIITYHKGTIDIQSEMKKGTVITVKLPRSPLSEDSH